MWNPGSSLWHFFKHILIPHLFWKSPFQTHALKYWIVSFNRWMCFINMHTFISTSLSNVICLFSNLMLWNPLALVGHVTHTHTIYNFWNFLHSFKISRIFHSLRKLLEIRDISVQFSSVAQSCSTLCTPVNHSTPGFPVHHQLLEFTQTYVHRVGDAIQPSHPLSLPSPPAPNPSQHQGLFQWVNSSHEMAKVLEFQPQHQSFQWKPRTGLL